MGYKNREDELRVLLIEDREEDFYIISRSLRRDGLEFIGQRVDNIEDFEAAILEHSWDVIISDFNLPGFNAVQALDLLRESRPHIPFIVVSGSIGEEQAVELIRHGAADFLMKDRLARLGHVVRRELRDSAQREHQRRLEREVKHLQRIEALGSLAGGIAHNFRNVLMAVRGLGELASGKLPADHPAAEDLSQMLEATSRTEHLVDKILRFSRKDRASVGTCVDLHDAIVNAIAMLRATLPSMIQLQYEGPESAVCRGSADEVEQIVVNLCSNAAQAMDGSSGRISLLVDRCETTEPGPALLPPGNYYRLRVIDDGPGMSEETIEHIFEPFFTTKPPGEGTGLGLAMVQRAMTELGGTVQCSSRPGEGTVFELFFPQAAEVDQKKEADATQSPGLGHGERILLVDDEPILANLAASFLAQAGYRVSKFYDPDSALGAYRDHPQDYDMLLTDLAMPSMTGVDLASEMRAIRPELPVVLCTGYGGEPGAVMHKHCDVVLGKPCGRVELYGAVREALEMHKVLRAEPARAVDFRATA